MALNDDAVFTAAKGYIFVCDGDTPPPALAAVTAFTPAEGIVSMDGDGTTEIPWLYLGHTSRDDLPEFGFDGGDSEPKGSWQNASLRTVQSEAPVDTVEFHLLQFDRMALTLYYGDDTSDVSEAGVFKQNAASTAPTRRALLIIIVDGDRKVAFYAGRTDIARSDSMELEVDEFASMPLSATVLDGPNGRLSWIGNTIQPAATG